jgi:hypothetical protein
MPDITKISHGLTIGDLKFGNARPGIVEATLKPGETLEQALDELDERLTAWHRKRYPHLYQEGEKKIGDFPKSEVTYGPLPIISKDTEEPENTLELIENAPDMAALASFKLLASRTPEFYKAYCDRLKYLSA